MSQLPYSKFYWSDWTGETALRACSLAARGLWIEMLAICGQSQRYGFLTQRDGQPMPIEALAKIVGDTPEAVTKLLLELEIADVFSRDRLGRIYSRRMIRESKSRADGRKNGKLGGNPTLSNQKEFSSGVNPKDREGGCLSSKTIARDHSQRPEEQERLSATRSSIEGIDLPPDRQGTALKNGGHNGHANGEAKIARHDEFPTDADLDYCATHWNERASAFGLPQIEKLTEPRRRQLRARLREGGDLASFCCTVNGLDEMPFLLGQSRPRNGSDAPFKADFDWIIKAANWQKIIEGKYKR